MVQIAEIENPFERFVAFIQEREQIRLRRLVGDDWPWTEDPILQTYRFTNINRENDKVSKHYQKSIRARYQNSALIIPGTVLYRWFNRIETCDALFNQADLLDNKSAFERYIDDKDPGILLRVLEKMSPPYITGAYIITGRAGLPKHIGVVDYFHQWCTHHEWNLVWFHRQSGPGSLADLFRWLDSPGLGSFMTAQLVADLKYLDYMRDASDWWTWASSGPGSKRGLNVLNSRAMDAPWTEREWLVQLHLLQESINPILKNSGIEPLHAQDLQNCLCEMSKYEKVRLGLGRPRQIYRSP